MSVTSSTGTALRAVLDHHPRADDVVAVEPDDDGGVTVRLAAREPVPQAEEISIDYPEGSTTRVRSRERVLEPSRVMSLGRGWAAVLVLGDGASVRVTRIFPPTRSR